MTFVHADAESEPCMVLTEAVKGGSPSLRVTPPLLLYQPPSEGKQSRALTSQAQAVYDSCRLYDQNNYKNK
jgi:tRNA1(Val) A37 N6-methylase TrmN6